MLTTRLTQRCPSAVTECQASVARVVQKISTRIWRPKQCGSPSASPFEQRDWTSRSHCFRCLRRNCDLTRSAHVPELLQEGDLCTGLRPTARRHRSETHNCLVAFGQ